MIASPARICVQPGLNTSINNADPLSAGLAAALMYGKDYVKNVWATVALKSPTVGSSMRESVLPSFKCHKKGMRTMWSGSTPGAHYFNFGTAPFDFNSNPSTVLVAYWPISHPTTTNYGRLFQVLETASSAGFLIAQETDGSFTRAIQVNALGSTAKKRHTANSAYTLLTPLTVVVTNDVGTAATTIRIFLDGVEASYNSTGQTDGVSLVTAASSMIVGNAGFAAQDTNTRQLDAVVPVVLVWNRILTDSEIKAISENPYIVFKPTSDNFEYYFNTVSVGGSVDLSIADALHSQVVDLLTLTTESVFGILESVHSHNVDNLTLSVSGSTDLAISESFHAHSVDNVNLATEWLLTVADASHTQIADVLTLDLSDATNLTIADASHTHNSDSLILTLASWLSVAGALQSVTSDNLALSLESFLQVADSSHAQRAENCALNTGGGSGLTLEEILAAVKADPMILTVPRWLVLRNLM